MKRYGEFNKDDDDGEGLMCSPNNNNNYSFVVFSKVTDDQSTLAAFEDMDANQGGVVRFSEYCDWIIRQEISWTTPLGKLLEGSVLQIKNSMSECGTCDR